jgi:hypothetical protein
MVFGIDVFDLEPMRNGESNLPIDRGCTRAVLRPELLQRNESGGLFRPGAKRP